MQRARAILLYATSLAPPHFSTLSHKRNDFQNKLLNLKSVFWFSLQLLYKTFHILKLIQRNSVTNVQTPSCKIPVIFTLFLDILTLEDGTRNVDAKPTHDV